MLECDCEICVDQPSYTPGQIVLCDDSDDHIQHCSDRHSVQGRGHEACVVIGTVPTRGIRDINILIVQVMISEHESALLWFLRLLVSSLNQEEFNHVTDNYILLEILHKLLNR